MGAALKSSWALFLGLWLIMLGNGLQGSLVGVRSQMENFDSTTTGLVMAGYFIGFFAGSFAVPRLLSLVGHIRVFAALAALASLAVIIYPLFVTGYAWMAIRILTGLSYAGLYIVCESWLNEKATNDTRGQLLAIYMIVSLTGMAGGQLLLNLYSPADFQLFTVVSVLISIAALPVLLSDARAPNLEAQPESTGPVKLYRASPMGVASIFMSGIIAGVVVGMGPVYAYKLYGTAFASLYMTALFIGGFVFNWPIGKLSDIFDRRKIIILAAIVTGLAALASLIIADPSTLSTGERFIQEYRAASGGIEFDKWILLGLAAILGGFMFPLYSLSIAHTNDYLTPAQLVSASSTLIMLNGFGAMLGPSMAGAAMDFMGVHGYSVLIAAITAAIILFGLWRMTQRAPLPSVDQGDYVAVSASMGTIAVSTLHPDAVPLEEDPETAMTEDEGIDVADEDEVPDVSHMSHEEERSK